MVSDILERHMRENNKMKHSELTRKVIKLMAENNEQLLTQFNAATIVEENDEVGYYVNFSFSNKNELPLLSSKLPSIIGKNADGKIIVGFVLFLKDGYIDCFEGYTFGNELWPENDDDISLEIAN